MLTDVQRLAEEAMNLSAVLDELYMAWWIRARETSSTSSRVTAVVESFESEVWGLLDAQPTEYVTVIRDSEVAVIQPGEWLERDAGSVEVRRRCTWMTEHFLWRNSQRLMPLMARRWRARLYVPATAEATADFMRIAAAFDEVGVWFQAKTNAAAVQRTDQSVFWVEASDALRAAGLASDALAGASFLETPPPLTLRIGNIGLAHDPGGGDSLGQRICGALVGARDAGEVWNDVHWESACERFDLTPGRPWRHPGPVDPYGLWADAEAAAVP